MTGNEKVIAQSPATLDILVFTITNVYCGIDSELIGRMMMSDEAAQKELKILWFHKALSFGEREVVYRNPRVVTLKGDGDRIGLAIDQPRDFVKVPVKSICPPPSLIAMTNGLQAFWGAFVLDDKVVLLIDPYKLTRLNIELSTY